MHECTELFSHYQNNIVLYFRFRVLFVRAGTQSGALSSSMKSNNFRNFFIGLTQIFTGFNVLTYCTQIFTMSGTEKSYFLLYQACYQPDGVT